MQAALPIREPSTTFIQSAWPAGSREKAPTVARLVRLRVKRMQSKHTNPNKQVSVRRAKLLINPHP